MDEIFDPGLDLSNGYAPKSEDRHIEGIEYRSCMIIMMGLLKKMPDIQIARIVGISLSGVYNIYNIEEFELQKYFR